MNDYGILFIIIFIYFWLHWVFVAACDFFSSCGKPGLLFVVVHQLLIAELLLLWAQPLGTQASVVAACELKSVGSGAVAHGL